MLQRYVIKHNYATHFKFFFKKSEKNERDDVIFVAGV